MGYTHYWRIHKPLDPQALSAYLDDARIVIANSPVEIVYEWDEPDRPPMVDDHIHLNGPDDYGYETFCFPVRTRSDGFGFCKTNCKPYDVVVTALLLLARDHFPEECLEISSDGTALDWQEGADLYRKCFVKEPVALVELGE